MATKSKQTSKHDRIDLDLTMGLIGNALLSSQGVDQLKQIMSQAKDPTAVLGQVAYHAISAAKDKIAQKGMPVAGKIWTARGGVIDQTIAETAKVVAGVGNTPEILNPKILEGAREEVLNAFHQQDLHMGGPGRPQPGDEDGDGDENYDNDQDEDESQNDAIVKAQYQHTMPPGEAGGSHGPNRMPAPPPGLLAQMGAS